ncbi:MAG: hypothetical protein IJR20_03605 [Muribaculaceae bacterium]|nr:hypothetical protein [Muribaculaceae bacterium]
MKRYINCSKRFFVMLLACLTVTCMMAQYKDATRHQSQGSSKPSTSKQATPKTSSKSPSKTSTKVAPKTTAPRRAVKQRARKQSRPMRPSLCSVTV